MKRFIVLTLSLMLIGVGCRSTSPSSNNTSSTSSNGAVVYLHPERLESENEKNIREFQTAVENFRNAKSFQALISIQAPEGESRGAMEIMKPDRFHGRIQTPDQTEASEFIGIGPRLYIRAGGSPWQAFESPKVTQVLQSIFRSAVEGDSTLTTHLFSTSTQMTKWHDGSNNCDRYETTIQESAGQTINIQLCVRDGLPLELETSLKDKTVHIEYTKYHSLFSIERPILLR